MAVPDIAGRLEALAQVAALAERVENRSYSAPGGAKDWYRLLAKALLALAEENLPKSGG
jgi:hypothetical protein